MTSSNTRQTSASPAGAEKLMSTMLSGSADTRFVGAGIRNWKLSRTASDATVADDADRK